MKLKVVVIVITIWVAGLSLYTIYNKPEYVKTELYFGLSNDGGPILTDAWNTFRKDKAEKLLSGFTEVKADGYWTSNTGKPVDENTIILIYIHKNTASETQKIDSLIKLYKKEFHQELVIQTNQEIEVLLK